MAPQQTSTVILDALAQLTDGADDGRAAFALFAGIVGAVRAGDRPTLQLAVTACSAAMDSEAADRRMRVDPIEAARQFAFLGLKSAEF
jgi:hypothetical protein